MSLKIDKPTLIFIAICAVSGAACWLLRGWSSFVDALVVCAELLVFVTPQLAAGLLIGGLTQQLVSKEKAAALLGERSKMRGLLLATLAGIVTPGGPFTSFPLVYALWMAGADAGALVAYLVSWALIGINRIIVWEIPFLGLNFSLFRFAVCLPLPILAGLLARFIATHTALKLENEAAP